MNRTLKHSICLLAYALCLCYGGVQALAEELPPIQSSELGHGEIAEVVAVEPVAPSKAPAAVVVSVPSVQSQTQAQTAQVNENAPLGAEMMFASSVQLSLSSNPIEQRAGDILFKQYVDKYGANYQGLFAAKQGAVANGDVLSGVQSLLAKAGVDINQLKKKITRSDWSGVEESLHEARETRSLDQDDQESLAQKIAASFKRDIFSMPSTGETGSPRPEAKVEFPTRPPRQVTQEQIERVVRESESKTKEFSPTTSEDESTREWDPMILENMGIQRLSKGINIFRLAHYRIGRTNLQRSSHK